MKKDGITVECIGCKVRKLLTFQEAANLKETPSCDKCYLPMVAIEASVRGHK